MTLHPAVDWNFSDAASFEVALHCIGQMAGLHSLVHQWYECVTGRKWNQVRTKLKHEKVYT